MSVTPIKRPAARPGAPAEDEASEHREVASYDHSLVGTIRIPDANGQPIMVEGDFRLRKMRSPDARRQAAKRERNLAEGLVSITLVVPVESVDEIKALAQRRRREKVSSEVPGSTDPACN